MNSEVIHCGDSAGVTTATTWHGVNITASTGLSATVPFYPPPRDDGKGDQFPDAPTGVREPRRPKPHSPSDAIALSADA